MLCGRRRPPVGEQLLEGQGGGVVGGRDVDDQEAIDERKVVRVHENWTEWAIGTPETVP